MALNALNSNNLEQLALKGLNSNKTGSIIFVIYLRSKCFHSLLFKSQ